MLEPIEVKTPFGDLKLNCRRPTDQELLLSDQLLYRQEYAARFSLWAKCIVGWLDLEDENGKQIPFNEKNLHKLLQRPEIQKAFGDVLFSLFTETIGVGEKNLQTSGDPSGEVNQPTTQ